MYCGSKDKIGPSFVGRVLSSTTMRRTGWLRVEDELDHEQLSVVRGGNAQVLGLQLTEDEAFALLSLAIVTPHRLDSKSLALLLKLADHCKSYGEGEDEAASGS